MSKMSDQFHENYRAHHVKKAEIHAGHAEAHQAMMDHHQDGPEHEYHKTKHELHKAAHETHAKLADYHAKSMKAAGDELGKADRLPAPLENFIRATLTEMLSKTVIPCNVSGVTPTAPAGVRMVPRAGQKEPEAPNVDSQFAKLVSTGNDEAPLM